MPLKPQRTPLLHLRSELGALFGCHLLQTFALCRANFRIQLLLALLKRTQFDLGRRSYGRGQRVCRRRTVRDLLIGELCLTRLNTPVDQFFCH